MIHRLFKKASNEFWLEIDKEFEETMGNPPLCQECHSILTKPFYWCSKNFKWICKDCELKEGDLKLSDETCLTSRSFNRTIKEHPHFCIKGVKRLKDD